MSSRKFNTAKLLEIIEEYEKMSLRQFNPTKPLELPSN